MTKRNRAPQTAPAITLYLFSRTRNRPRRYYKGTMVSMMIFIVVVVALLSLLLCRDVGAFQPAAHCFFSHRKGSAAPTAAAIQSRRHQSQQHTAAVWNTRHLVVSSWLVLTATKQEGDDTTSASAASSIPYFAPDLADNNKNNNKPPHALESINEDGQTTASTTSNAASQSKKRRKKKKQKKKKKKKELELQWCTEDVCKDVVRERAVGEHHQIILCGPATGQVVYIWQESYDDDDDKDKDALPRRLAAAADVDEDADSDNDDDDSEEKEEEEQQQALRSVLLLVKPGDERLMKIAAAAVRAWTDDEEVQKPQDRIIVLLDPSTAARLKHYHGVDGKRIHLFEDKTPTPGFGSNLRSSSSSSQKQAQAHDMDDLDLFDFDEAINPEFGGPLGGKRSGKRNDFDYTTESIRVPKQFLHEPIPDLICTLGGDGLLMHAGMLFQGPVPPILCVAGGSLGFLTTFSTDEMIEAVRIALDIRIGQGEHDNDHDHDNDDHVNNDLYDYAYNNMHYKPSNGISVYPPNMESYPPRPPPPPSSSMSASSSTTPAIDVDATPAVPRFSFGPASGGGGRICLSIRMRLCCCIFNREGVLRARYNVLNEVVIDRGSSPYLAALECFCDDVHLTTVQADGIIFATPTGSTAYSMAAGGSVVHPAVPCILVTPICPHVLSFRSMVFPDHVVLRVYVPDDARAEASVAFDGKHRQELRRGDSVQIKMSAYPIPTINRLDHSSDWLGSLKRNFNFNTRPRQRPL